MRIAIVYNDKEIYVEFSPSKFRELLRRYLEQYKDIDIAMDNVIRDLRKEALKR